MYLETPRLVLRALQAEDAEPLALLWSDERVTRYMGGPRRFNELRQSFLDDARNPEPSLYDLWPLVEKSSGQVIGYCGVADKEVEGQAEYELIYVLAASVWGRGYASEIATALRDYAFNTLGLPRLIAWIEAGNTASVQVAEKVGLRLEKEIVRPGGQRRKLYTMLTPLRTAYGTP